MIKTLRTVAMAALAMVSLSSTAQVEIDFAQQGYDNAEAVEQIEQDGVTLTFDKGTNRNAPKYYDAGTAIRLYGGNSMTVTGTATIKKVEIEFGTGDGSNAITTDVEAYENGTWTGSAESVTFTIGGTSGNRRFKKVTVTMADDSSDTRTATTVTISADGITNTNLFDGTAAGTLTATVAAGETVLDAAVTWTSGNTDVATVNEAGVVTLVAAGTTTITAEYAGDDSYKGSKASYQLTVTNIDPNAPGTIGNPYTVAQAIAAIDANEGVTGVYATGIVSQIVDEYSSQFNNISFDISADGTTDGAQLRAYRCTKADGDDAPAVDDVQVGDVVVIYGNLTLYKNSIYEFTAGNTLVSLQRAEDERTATELLFVDEETIVKEGNEGTTIELATAYIYDGTLEVEGQITWKSSNEEVATIDAQAGIINLLKEGTATITATFAGDDNYKGCTNSYNITVNAVVEPGEEADITYDIANDFDVIDGVLTDGTVSFTGYGPDNFKKNTGYFMMGKNGAYINFPTYEKEVAKIVVTGNSSGSASTVMNIYVGEDAVSEETVGSKGTNVYVIEDGYRTAGTQYTLKVTSSHNAQITKIEIFFVNDSPATAIATVKAAAANGAAYNLAGQRVAEGYKGLVIVNGKKQLVK